MGLNLKSMENLIRLLQSGDPGPKPRKTRDEKKSDSKRHSVHQERRRARLASQNVLPTSPEIHTEDSFGSPGPIGKVQIVGQVSELKSDSQSKVEPNSEDSPSEAPLTVVTSSGSQLSIPPYEFGAAISNSAGPKNPFPGETILDMRNIGHVQKQSFSHPIQLKDGRDSLSGNETEQDPAHFECHALSDLTLDDDLRIVSDQIKEQRSSSPRKRRAQAPELERLHVVPAHGPEGSGKADGTSHREMKDCERIVSKEHHHEKQNHSEASNHLEYLKEDIQAFGVGLLSTDIPPAKTEPEIGALEMALRAPADSVTLTDLKKMISILNEAYTHERAKNAEQEVLAIATQCGWTLEHQEYPEVQQNILTVVSFLGQGSMGFVEEVRVPNPTRNHPSFVRKRVQLPHLLRRKRLEIVKQEAATLKNLRNPHIVKIIGTYQDGPARGRQFYSLLMFPVGQGDLKTLIEIDADEEMRVKRNHWFPKWFCCLSSALKYMHDHGVRHQDIKPSNIIHCGDKIFFTDFSSSSTFAVGQTTSTENPARASYMYAAPETFSSEEGFLKHGRGTDVFALVIVFCEMLAILLDGSIEQFHEFIINSSKRGDLSYGRSTAAIDEFYSSHRSQHVGATFYTRCLRDAIAINRNDRPDAAQFTREIREASVRVWYNAGCSCRDA